MVFPDGDLFEPAFYQGLVEFSKVGTLLFNEVLQVVDSCNLCVSGGGVNRAFFTPLTELENLVSNLIVGFLVVSFLEKLFLEFNQLFINAISGGILGISDDFSDVLL